MNIVFLDFDDIQNPLLGAGQAFATYQVGKELVKLGHNVSVISSRYPGYQDRVQDGILYTHIGLGTNNVQLNNAFFFVAAPYAIRKLNPKKIDIVIECFTAPISTLFSPVFTRIPVVVLPSMFNAQEFEKKYHLPLQWIEKFGCKFYNYCMPYSNIDQKKITDYNPSIKTQIIPQGVSDYFLQLKHQKPNHILFLSRLDIHQKGIDLLLKAYQSVKDSVGYPLVIAGHGPDEAKVKQMITDLGLDGQVTMVGSAYGDKKEQLIQKALYTVFPSRHDEMCLWTLESLASALPLVCFDIPESNWIPNTVALKVPCFDAERFGAAMVELAQDGSVTAMQRQARKFASQFSWKKTAEQFIMFFTKIKLWEKKR